MLHRLALLFLLASYGALPAVGLSNIAGRGYSHAPLRRHGAPLKRNPDPSSSGGVRFHRQKRAKKPRSESPVILTATASSSSSLSVCTPSFDNLTSLDAWASLTAGANTYALLPGGGVELFLQRPTGPVSDYGGQNDALGTGSTLNATQSMLYGRITYDIALSAPAGVVGAAILMGTERSLLFTSFPCDQQCSDSLSDDSGDEIDIELLPAHPTTFQTNVFKPAPTDSGPLFGVFAEVPTLGSPSAKGKSAPSVTGRHTYTIDWSPETIVWSVDGLVRRTLQKSDTTYEGSFEHFPSALTRPQIGIWFAVPFSWLLDILLSR